MSQFGWHDCPAGVKEQVARLVDGFKRQLGGNLIGVYLHGSLATGCFNPLRSDIDLLVAVREKMNLDTKRALAQLMLDVSNEPAPVEISFLTPENLHPWRHPAPYDFHYSEDWRAEFTRGDWREIISGEHSDVDLAGHITVLNHRGLCLYGKPIAEVFPAIPEADFVDSILADVLSVKYGLNGAFEIYPIYIVLNACRTLAYLRTKRVMSKEEGGYWALENLPEKFKQTVAGALNEYRNGRLNDETGLSKESLIEFSIYLKNEIERARA